MESFLEELRGCEVLHWRDNQAVVQNPHQRHESLTSDDGRAMEVVAVIGPGGYLAPNSLHSFGGKCLAVQLSRRENCDDWMLDLLEAWYGPHRVERFASANNTHLARFNSEFNSPGSEGVDAMAVSRGTLQVQLRGINADKALVARPPS